MKADDAIATVVDLEVVRARVRHDLEPQASVRVPLLVFGVLTLGSAAVAASGAWLGLYWLVAAPLGLAVVGRHYQGLRQRVGAGPEGTAPMVAGVALGTVAFVTGWTLGPAAAGVAIGVGYSAMAVVVRSRTMAWLGPMVVLASVLLLVVGAEHTDVVLPAALGTALVLTGLRS